MTQTDGDTSSSSWGTWEELILAFAVNRHGTASWESIASELQKRTSDPNLSLTAQNCRSKYLDLKRRFVVAPNHDSDVKSSVDDSAAPLLEELRKLRVAELRREVERYDLSIESLELKVKRMEEERQRSLREKSASDLENKSEEEKRDVDPEAEPAGGGETVVGEGIDKDQLSVNESNSTDPEAEKSKTGERGSEPAGPGAEEVRAGETSQQPADSKPEPDRKSGREDSCNGSSNSIEKSDRKTNKEAVTESAESNGGGEAGKDNSDVQSTASRSRKEEGCDKVRRRGNTSGDEEDQQLPTQSQPLFDFLQAIRSHKLASIFQRRLRSQETSQYQKLILQHIDFEMVEKKLRQRHYSGSQAMFFRDLLLLVNNAIVFFPNNSPESNAACDIRALISKEISRNTPKSKSKSNSSSGKQISLQSLSKKDEPTDPSNSLMLKPRLPGSLVVCRKRSSIVSKASDKNKDPGPASDKCSKKASDSTEEVKVTRKRTRDNRFTSATSVNTRKNSKNNTTTTTNINNQSNNSSSPKQHGKGGGLSSEQKNSDGKKTTVGPDSKKRGAANFLNRMKQGSSPSNNGDLLDALKKTPLTGEGSGSGGKAENKKSNESVKHGEKKEQVTRRSTAEARLGKEKGSPGKRNVGRPPKRGAAPSVAGERGRDRSENETPPPGKQPKKRVRKL